MEPTSTSPSDHCHLHYIIITSSLHYHYIMITSQHYITALHHNITSQHYITTLHHNITSRHGLHVNTPQTHCVDLVVHCLCPEVFIYSLHMYTIPCVLESVLQSFSYASGKRNYRTVRGVCVREREREREREHRIRSYVNVWFHNSMC